ncbi:hypothetical protein GCM10011613_20580 [Cellvibrio zantedeschiae]|uniref:Lipoprotein n=1 Tax=Cellvibrio zantedeschiae TaxID=1237077 RepID=A0ABQ3B4L2_9GAMM|nr:hypothetical protein [Cellvibrio zantedeschiae]GGY74987.1 hypothetical protein GCM10011613_20580 [Cellvibrio zantedeschiae]
MKIYIFAITAIISGCASFNENTLFFGEIESINTEPLEVDGEAEVVVRIDKGETIRFFVTSCNPPAGCSKKTVDLLSRASLQHGARVEVSAYLWRHPKGSKYIIEKPNGYIKKI